MAQGDIQRACDRRDVAGVDESCGSGRATPEPRLSHAPGRRGSKPPYPLVLLDALCARSAARDETTAAKPRASQAASGVSTNVAALAWPRQGGAQSWATAPGQVATTSVGALGRSAARARAQGSAVARDTCLSAPWSGTSRQHHMQAHPVVLLPSGEDRRHAGRSAQGGPGIYLT